MRGSNGFGKGLRKVGAAFVANFDQQNRYLVTLALVSSRENRRSRPKTSIFTIENHNLLVQVASQASWPRDMPADSLESGNPGFGPLGIEVEKQGFQTVRLITSQKFP